MSFSWPALNGLFFSNQITHGPVAQLGERCVRIAEVKGSNPSRSTKYEKHPVPVEGTGFFMSRISEKSPCQIFSSESGERKRKTCSLAGLMFLGFFKPLKAVLNF